MNFWPHWVVQLGIQIATAASKSTAFRYLLLCHFVQVSESNGSKVFEYASVFFVDDKAIVPVGEPERPVSTNVRAHGGALVPGDKILGALDHNFHICGLVPSVVLKSDVPDNVNDSFYKGTVFRDKYRKLVFGNSKYMRKYLKITAKVQIQGRYICFIMEL